MAAAAAVRSRLAEVLCDPPRHYLVDLAARWVDRADRAGLRADRLRLLGEAWAVLAVTGLGCDSARADVVAAILGTLSPFERAALVESPATAGSWALDLGYVDIHPDRDAAVYTPIGEELVRAVDREIAGPR